jgi:hypothetical protein
MSTLIEATAGAQATASATSMQIEQNTMQMMGLSPAQGSWTLAGYLHFRFPLILHCSPQHASSSDVAKTN